MSRPRMACLAPMALALFVSTNAGADTCVDYADEIRLATDRDPCFQPSGGSVEVADGYAYRSRNVNVDLPYGGTEVMDLSNPYDPVIVDNFSFVMDGEPYRYQNLAVGHGVIAARYHDVLYFSPSFDTGEPISFDSSLPLPDFDSIETAIGPSHAYVVTPDAGGENLRVADVANLAAPAWGAVVYVGVPVEDALVLGNHLYLAGLGLGVLIYDISNPASPTPVTNLVLGHDVSYLDTTGGFLTATGDGGLTVIDVSVPASAFARGALVPGAVPAATFSRHVARDGVVYVLTDEGTVAVVDANDPDDLTVTGAVAVLDWIGDLGVSDETLLTVGTRYSGFGHPGCFVASFAINKGRLDAVLSDAGVDRGRDVAVRGDHAYVRTNQSIDVVDVSTPASPTPVGAIAGTDFRDVHAYGDRLYVTRGTAGYEIYGLADPVNPAFLGSESFGGAFGFFVDGTTVYAGDASSFRIVDVSDPAQPLQVGFSGHSADAIVVDGGVAYLVYAGYGLYVLDVSTPSLPSEIARFPLAGNPGAAGVVKVGDYLYVPVPHEDRVQSIDVSNPASPLSAGSVTVGPGTNDVVADQGLLYVTQSHGLTVVSLADPAAPALLGGTHVAMGLGGLAVDGFLYAGGEGGLVVLAPQCPSATPVHSTPGSVGGASVLRVAPTPVRTILTIRLAAADGVASTADVFDVAGRRIDTVPLAPEGTWHVGVWDARGAAPGVYFVRAETAAGAVVRRAIRVE